MNDPDSIWESFSSQVWLNYILVARTRLRNEFLSPEYTYIMDKNGEIQYFIHEKLSSNYLKGSLGRIAEGQFHSVCPDLNFACSISAR